MTMASSRVLDEEKCENSHGTTVETRGKQSS